MTQIYKLYSKNGIKSKSNNFHSQKLFSKKEKWDSRGHNGGHWPLDFKNFKKYG